MDQQRPEAGSLRTAVELAEVGVLMHRQFLRRIHPHATENELDDLMDAWIHERHRNEFDIAGFRQRRSSLA
jgi:hypothetical protein